MIATCDYVKSVKRSNKTMYLSFDEWNVHRFPEEKYEQWKTASPIDWVHFTMEDTLLFASMLLSIIRHADRVKIACQSLLVNTIPLILTEENGKAWANPTYYPMLHASLFGRGTLMHSNMSCEKYDNSLFNDIPIIDHVVIENNDDITIFAINRTENNVLLKSNLQGYRPEQVIEHIGLSSPNLEDINTSNHSNLVSPKQISNTIIEDGLVKSELPAYSWNVIRVSK